MEDTVVAGALKEQFAKTWETLREIVQAFPEDEWENGETVRDVPVRWGYHIVATADGYAKDRSTEGHNVKPDFELDWENADIKRLPDRETFAGLIDLAQQRVDQWLDSMQDAGLFAAETAYPWAGQCVLGRAIYALRHNQHHIGELNAILRRRGLLNEQGGKWH